MVVRAVHTRGAAEPLPSFPSHEHWIFMKRPKLIINTRYWPLRTCCRPAVSGILIPSKYYWHAGERNAGARTVGDKEKMPGGGVISTFSRRLWLHRSQDGCGSTALNASGKVKKGKKLRRHIEQSLKVHNDESYVSLLNSQNASLSLDGPCSVHLHIFVLTVGVDFGEDRNRGGGSHLWKVQWAWLLRIKSRYLFLSWYEVGNYPITYCKLNTKKAWERNSVPKIIFRIRHKKIKGIIANMSCSVY